MSWRISIVELPDGEILIDGQPTDFAPPWKTEDAIRQQARDIAELRSDLTTQVQATARIATERAMEQIRADAAVAEREQLRADLAAAVAARDWQIQATKAAIESCNQATTAGLAAVAERNQLRARLAAIEAAPVVARVFESNRDFATGPSRCLAYTNSELPVPGTELIAKPAKDAP